MKYSQEHRLNLQIQMVRSLNKDFFRQFKWLNKQKQIFTHENFSFYVYAIYQTVSIQTVTIYLWLYISRLYMHVYIYIYYSWRVGQCNPIRLNCFAVFLASGRFTWVFAFLFVKIKELWLIRIWLGFLLQIIEHRSLFYWQHLEISYFVSIYKGL